MVQRHCQVIATLRHVAKMLQCPDVNVDFSQYLNSDVNILQWQYSNTELLQYSDGIANILQCCNTNVECLQHRNSDVGRVAIRTR